MNSLAHHSAYSDPSAQASALAASVALISRALAPVPLNADVFATDAAMAAATRAALGLPQAFETPRRVAEEALAAHAERILTHWPRAFGWTAPTPPVLDDVAGMREALFGPKGMPRTIEDFEHWLDSGCSIPARCLSFIWRRWDSRWGRATPPILTPQAASFALDWRRAELDGVAVENTPAGRLADCDLMRAIEARRGRGVVWRLAAQLSDCAHVLDALSARCDFDGLCTPAPGVGAVCVATGTLYVRVLQGDGAGARLVRLTPEDCVAHPEGLFWQTMRGPSPRGAARPVGYRAMVRHAAGAPVPAATQSRGRFGLG